MNLLLTTRIALRALAKNKMRAGLTVLGVVIGIAAVTTMVSLGTSASGLVQKQFESFGTNILLVLPGDVERGGVRQGFGGLPSLTAEDCDAIVRQCPSVLAASPILGAQSQVVYGSENWRPDSIEGVGHLYPSVRDWSVRLGGFFTEQDVAGGALVCVIGHTVALELFRTSNPIGETVRISNIPFEVVGVLESKGANMFGEDQDNIVMVPFTTVLRRIYRTQFRNIGAIFASAKRPQLMPNAEREIKQLLMARHRIAPGASPDFQVRNSKEFAEALGMVTGTLTLLLASIAAISLLVGGVGIMNIMLVSVTERTREIGIRMAVGARGRDILRQFLIESILLSMIGGLIGFALGCGASVGATTLINHYSSGMEWPVTISIPAAIVAIIFAACVGMFFGYYPAMRASRLDPIEALRYE